MPQGKQSKFHLDRLGSGWWVGLRRQAVAKSMRACRAQWAQRGPATGGDLGLVVAEGVSGWVSQPPQFIGAQ